MTRAPSSPQVTIVVPFHQAYARYLADCLTSIGGQTFVDWEAIVVDDASTDDDSYAIVDRLGDARIRVIRHERNRGCAAARNTGIRSGVGAFLMTIDCDDVVAPTHLEKLMRALADRPDCGAAYADYFMFAAQSGKREFPVRDVPALLREQWIPHGGALVRRTLWELANGYCEDEVFRVGNEDWDYWLSVAEKGLRAVRVPEPLYGYRQHAHSMTNCHFQYADFVTRERIYVRHRSLFDRFGMRRAFLSGGYRVSGRAFWRKGERLRGLRLLAYSAWLSPGEFARAASARLRRTALLSNLVSTDITESHESWPNAS